MEVIQFRIEPIHSSVLHGLSPPVSVCVTPNVPPMYLPPRWHATQSETMQALTYRIPFRNEYSVSNCCRNRILGLCALSCTSLSRQAESALVRSLEKVVTWGCKTQVWKLGRQQRLNCLCSQTLLTCCRAGLHPNSHLFDLLVRKGTTGTVPPS